MKRHTKAGVAFLATCVAMAAGIYSQIRPVATERPSEPTAPTAATNAVEPQVPEQAPEEADQDEVKPDNLNATRDCLGTWTDGNSPELEIRMTPTEYFWQFDGKPVSQGSIKIQISSPNILLKFDGRTFGIDCGADAITVQSEPASEENGWIPRGDSWEMSRK
ncbi:hypothetical protein [Sphingomonas turrisvirgatae]|uniref:Uncharacterized protein n=1 Tax=Sphingomonas turrisvirgatae TaxID=1888892 RepID=A0A1E3LTM9_9SPHN|nr:hypothetical protein [Sphingomonas turrisvirgatae]ODP37083.1 hypothetical protein BFL28_18965 [Sphingomonas turrisvirgatae]